MGILRVKNKEVDMLQGNILKQILLFAIPLMGGNLFAQLYSLIDAAIVGHFVGVNAFAAIGCTGWITWLLLALCRDISNAICIMGSYQIGAKCSDAFKRVIVTALYLGVALTVLACVPMIFAIDRILALNQVPSEIYSDAKIYLLIYILAIPFSMIYSMASAILRAAGNSIVPFISMVVSALVNIGLDLYFVVWLGMGVEGAAWATFIAQSVSAGMVFWGLISDKRYRVQKYHWKLDKALCKEAVSLWIPMFWNSIIITVGGIYVQAGVNGVGAAFSAGYSAAVKVFNVIEAIVISIQTALSVYIGQNLGAQQVRRIRKGFEKTLLLTIFLMALCTVFIWIFSTQAVSLFLTDNDATVYQVALKCGRRQIRYMMVGTLAMVPMYFLRTGMQSIGYPRITLIAGIVQMIARYLTITVLEPYIGNFCYHWTDPIAWLLSLPVVAIPFLYYLRRLEKNV